LAMSFALWYGFTQGDFSADGARLLANPWGIVSLFDLYVGFALFSVWIAYREKHGAIAAVWIVAMMILGFFAGSAYVLWTAYRYKTDVLGFFLGARKESVLRSVKR